MVPQFAVARPFAANDLDHEVVRQGRTQDAHKTLQEYVHQSSTAMRKLKRIPFHFVTLVMSQLGNVVWGSYRDFR